jgi:hypothetical protein
VPDGQIIRTIGIWPRSPAFTRTCTDDSGQIFGVAGREAEINQAVQERGDRPMKRSKLHWIGQLPVTNALDCRPDLFCLQGEAT